MKSSLILPPPMPDLPGKAISISNLCKACNTITISHNSLCVICKSNADDDCVELTARIKVFEDKFKISFIRADVAYENNKLSFARSEKIERTLHTMCGTISIAKDVGDPTEEYETEFTASDPYVEGILKSINDQ